MKCQKAIIAVAGYGTRRLPVAKAVEKCMLPLLNRPVVDYAVQDCIKAGITEIYFVVSEGADQLRRYYERDTELEDYLRTNGKEQLIPSIVPPEGVVFHYIEQSRQDPRYGTTVPVWLARDVIKADEQFAVIMGDQCLYRLDGGSEIAELFSDIERIGVSSGMIGVEVPKELVSQYGIIDMDEQNSYRRIVEKPHAEEAPSTLNNASIYVFPGSFIKYVDDNIQTAQGGEYMIIDAINNYVADGGRIHVRTSHAAYLDCGTVGGWVEANNFLYEHTRQ